MWPFHVRENMASKALVQPFVCGWKSIRKYKCRQAHLFWLFALSVFCFSMQCLSCDWARNRKSIRPEETMHTKKGQVYTIALTNERSNKRGRKRVELFSPDRIARITFQLVDLIYSLYITSYVAIWSVRISSPPFPSSRPPLLKTSRIDLQREREREREWQVNEKKK